ncbi:MAG: histidine phosphatase family protein [Saprospiraceae bacterium]|nr:histidine phosphatase family protein [Saprospiraceae bacterium]
MRNLYFILILIGSFFIISCNNSQKEDGIPFIKEFDKGNIILENGKVEPIPNWGDKNTTILIVVRHAEKVSDSADSRLTLNGEMRAGRLAHLLKKSKIDDVITTNTFRTILTGEPTQQMQSCNFVTYEAKNQDVMIRETLGRGPGKKFLVVGHTNTIPSLLNELTKTTDYKDIPSNEFDNIYVVATRGISQTKVLHFKYK